jgi:hypothetical protein
MIVLQICLAALLSLVAILELSIATCHLLHLRQWPGPAPQTDHIHKHVLYLLILTSAFHLGLSIIVVLLAFVLIFLLCFGGHDTACHTLLIISIAVVNCSKVRNYQCYETKVDLTL